MPRDATQTRDRLLAEAERLFAEQGIWQVRLQDIVAAAGQKNTSALTYHFGGRSGVLDEILRSHGEPIDRERGEIWAAQGSSSVVALVKSLVLPMTACLQTASGRCYLRIVAQLSPSFSQWELDQTHVPSNLNTILHLLLDRANAPDGTLQGQRVLGMIQLMSISLGERARQVEAEESDTEATDATEYAANLTDMLVGVVEARPLNSPVTIAAKSA